MKKISPILFFHLLFFPIPELYASLIISQYIETNSGTTPKGVELWNVSGSTIDFSSNNLVIKKGIGGGTPSTDYTLSSGTLFNGGVIVVGTSGDLETATTNNGGTHYTEGFTFNGDDALEIYLGGTLTDMFGVSGSDPGTHWSGSGVSTKNQNIQLKSGIWTGDTDGWTDPSTRFETVSTTPVSDQTGFGVVPGVLIAGNSGFRFMSPPVSDGTYSDLLAELWTQGMTNSDAPEADDDNVWSFALGSSAAGSYSALSDLAGTMTAGAGFMVYVFADNNNDGTGDLPVSLSVSGTESSGSVTYPASGSIDNGQYGLAGNPYYQTIDWDDVSKTNVGSVVYVYDNAKSGGAGWIQWDGSSGDVTDGLIAPFQGFWVLASSDGASITIETADKSNSSGTFYRMLDNDNEGSMYLECITSDGGYDKTWFSYREDGEHTLNGSDAHKLMPIMASDRLVSMTYAEDNSLNINNLPFEQESTIQVPLDVMSLTLEDGNYVTGSKEVTMSWDLEKLPDHIDLILTDEITGQQVYLNQETQHSFTTEPKGSFSATYDGPIGTYPVVGEPRFTLSVTYGALGQNDDATLPSNFALHPVYPNPFNPSATISFDIPDVSLVALNVYDVKGALVETLLQENMKPGKHQYNWEPQGLSSGVYFMKLTTAKQSFTQKVTYIK